MTKSVLETILEWSASRPEWQRDALRRIVATGTPSQTDINELVSLCKKGQGDDTVSAKAVPLQAGHLPIDPASGESVALTALGDVVGVNQLAGGQTLSFEPTGLNIVYGQNGTGKSGYARILKKACRARQAGEIMPDAFNSPPSGKATAKFNVETGTAGSQSVDWEDGGQPDPTLSAVTVFDRDCAAVHLKQKNEVWFRPFGLDIPDDLASVCQQVKEQLAAEREQAEQLKDPVFNNPIWSGTSKIGAFLNGLTANSSLTEIEDQKALSGEDERRLEQLQRDLGQDAQRAAQTQRQMADKIDQMLAVLKRVQAGFAEEAIQKLKELGDTARQTRSVADAAATRVFADLNLDGVGTPVWRGLWEAARRYSESLTAIKQDFPPNESDTCVLCHQPIDKETATRMRGFEDFVRADTEERAEAAAKAYQIALAEFTNARIDIRLIGEARKIIRDRSESLARSVLRFFASARLRRRQYLNHVSSGEALELRELENLSAKELEAIVAEIQAYADELAGAEDALQRQRLIAEFNNLRDLQQIERLKDIAEREIVRLKRVKRLDACIAETDTKAVTRLGNDIADNLITPKMRDRFAEEIGRLAAGRIRVEVVRSGGRFGSPQYEVKFFANPKAKVHLVLSEGEQTCVALASYLTELANASHKSALVFDDPISSLDHRWRRKVAERLVTESKERQVIVFSHDLIFVNDLHDMAANAGTLGKLGNLTRSNQGVGIFSEGLPWRASGVRDRVDKLEKAARKAKQLHDSGEEDKYRNEVEKIYGNLRATWERGLEDVVFAGVLQRHRDYINTKNLKKITVIEDEDVEVFDEGFQKCCDFIEAHDPSRGRDAEVPDPDEVMDDIKKLADWEKKLRDKHKAAA